MRLYMSRSGAGDAIVWVCGALEEGAKEAVYRASSIPKAGFVTLQLWHAGPRNGLVNASNTSRAARLPKSSLSALRLIGPQPWELWGNREGHA